MRRGRILAASIATAVALYFSGCRQPIEKPICKRGDHEMCKCADNAVGIRYCDDKGGWKACDCRGDYGGPLDDVNL